MSDCEKYQNMIVDALYEDLSSEERSILDKHLKECVSCRKDYEEMTATAKTMSRRIRPEPEAEFFDGFWDRLTERMDRERVPHTTPNKWWKSFLSGSQTVFPRWVYQAAVSILLVAVGIYLGRTFFTPDRVMEQPITMAKSLPESDAQASVSQRTFDYIQRSKLIVLAIANFDPENQDPYALDLRYQQQISKELVQEASWLKEELAARRQRRLQELVSDLEVILLQIANLEEESDMSAIELVQDGVKSRGILFKIHLAQFDNGSKARSEAGRTLNKSKSF